MIPIDPLIMLPIWMGAGLSGVKEEMKRVLFLYCVLF